jgi:hypothetical protein
MTEINKYQNGKIYKIVCNKTNLVYIGSTTEKYLCNRLKGHVYKFKENKTNYTSFKVLENNDYYIELIELYPCNSKDELLVRERYYFDIIDCVNKLKPKSTIDETTNRIKEYYKEYQQINKNKINETNKEYYQRNKDKIKEYKDNIKEEKKEYDKQRNQLNKDKIKEQKKEYNKQRYLKLKALKNPLSP